MPKTQPLHNKYIRWCIGWYIYFSGTLRKGIQLSLSGDDTAEQVLSRAPLLPGESLFEDFMGWNFSEKSADSLGSLHLCIFRRREMIWIFDWVHLERCETGRIEDSGKFEDHF